MSSLGAILSVAALESFGPATLLGVLALLLLAMGGVVFLKHLLAASNPRVARKVAYRPAAELLTAAERRFWAALRQACQRDARVFVKVRVADVLQPAAGLEGGRRWAALNRINCKHVDFVLAEPDSCRVLAAVELDDASHRRSDRQQRDRFVEQAFASAGVPLVRVAAAAEYSVEQLRGRLQTACGWKAFPSGEAEGLDGAATGPSRPQSRGKGSPGTA